MIAPRFAVPLTLALALGCSTGGDPAGTGSTSGAGGGASSGAGGAGGAGGEGGLPPIGGDRPVEVFVPSGYQDGTPAPLVILLHGYSSSGDEGENYFQLQPIAEARGFLYAHPDGTVDQGGQQFWNATDACCDLSGTGVDDSGYLRQVVDEIKVRYTVDPKRVFFLGHSNGGFMSFRMACDHADAIAAVASLAGAMAADPAACAPTEPVAALQIHGTDDPLILYEGGQLGEAPYPGALESVQRWVTLDGCDPMPMAGPALDLEADLPGAETTTEAFTGCDPGGHAELWSIAGAGHVPVLSAEFSTRVVDFLLAHPKP
jgi:polyhydroxybutyrate depolymerase